MELELQIKTNEHRDQLGNGDQEEEEILTDAQEELRQYQLTRDRTRRQIQATARYGQADVISFAFNIAEQIDSVDPLSYDQAIASKEKEKWITARNEEMDSLKKNKTWILVNKPK